MHQDLGGITALPVLEDFGASAFDSFQKWGMIQTVEETQIAQTITTSGLWQM